MAKTPSTCRALLTIWRNAARSSWRVLAGPAKTAPTPRMAVARTAAEAKATIEAASLHELRTKHGVSHVSVLDRGRKLSELAPGVYGYTTPWSIPSGIVLNSCLGTFELEIHKAKDGTRYLIGYADSLPSKEFTLCSAAWGSFRQPVAVPLVRIVAYTARSSERMWLLDIKTDECNP